MRPPSCGRWPCLDDRGISGGGVVGVSRGDVTVATRLRTTLLAKGALEPSTPIQAGAVPAGRGPSAPSGTSAERPLVPTGVIPTGALAISTVEIELGGVQPARVPVSMGSSRERRSPPRDEDPGYLAS